MSTSRPARTCRPSSLASARSAAAPAPPSPPPPRPPPRALGSRPGISISPPTALDAVEPVLDQVDQVMVMGVNPGWGGQALIPETLPKLRDLRARLRQRGLDPEIEIDGGVKVSNCVSCVEAGAPGRGRGP